MRAMEPPEGLSERAVYGSGDADPQTSLKDLPQRGDRVAAAVGGGQRRAGVRQQRLARIGERDRAPLPPEQHLAELQFEALQNAIRRIAISSLTYARRSLALGRR
jgi:hypothetical protein